MEGERHRVCHKAQEYLLFSAAAKTGFQTEASGSLCWQRQRAMDVVTPAEPSHTSEPLQLSA